MSKTFASRPAVVRGRGRGTAQRTQQAPRNPGVGADSDTQNQMSVRGQRTGPRYEGPGGVGRGAGTAAGSEPTSQTGDTGQASQEQRMSHTGAYTVISPNEKKRQEVMEAAREESERYQSYKQQNTPASFSIVGTVGGGQMTESEARRKTVQDSPTKYQRIQKVQAAKQTTRQREQEEIDKKKAEQRKKSEINARSTKTQQQKWDEDRRHTNEAHFRKLELESKSKQARLKGKADKTASLDETKPAAQPYIPTGQQASNARYVDYTELGACGTYDDTLTPEQDKRVTSLAVVFPDYSRLELTEILRQVDFSLDMAIELLQE